MYPLQVAAGAADALQPTSSPVCSMQMSVEFAPTGQQLSLLVTVAAARGAVTLTFFFFLPVLIVLRAKVPPLSAVQRGSPVVSTQAGQLSVPHSAGSSKQGNAVC